jgi:NCAIR mutase (PurE)-related protein
VSRALAELKDLPFHDMGFAKLDHHRTLRRGFPEAVFGAGKTPAQIEKIARHMAGRVPLIVTKTSAEVYQRIRSFAPKARFHPEAGFVYVPNGKSPKRLGRVLVLAAGTSDFPVAEEAAETAAALGCSVERVYDVGVAGLHRLLRHKRSLERAGVIIVAAGMDGALPSVVAGLTRQPVVAVPTSVGYGASFKGLAALLAMLNACAPGVALVNIDNGFGAGYLAASILST